MLLRKTKRPIIQSQLTSNKRIFVGKKSTSPKRGKKKSSEKPKRDGSALEDSQNTSQKDVIIRRIKKKGDNAKAAYSQSIGFVHKKSNSELVSEAKKHPKKNSVMSNPNTSMKKEDKMTRKEFRTHKYQNALDKFNEFKKEREMMRKNTPITKFRKGSAKRSRFSVLYFREYQE